MSHGQSVEIVDRQPLILERPVRQLTPMRVFRSQQTGVLAAVVREVDGNASLMNLGPSIYKAIQARHPGARVLEHWPADAGDFGPWRESRGKIGSLRISEADLQAMGFDPEELKKPFDL